MATTHTSATSTMTLPKVNRVLCNSDFSVLVVFCFFHHDKTCTGDVLVLTVWYTCFAHNYDIAFVN